jgi:hypothetical protein
MTNTFRTSDGVLRISCRCCLAPINALYLKEHQVLIHGKRLVKKIHIYHHSTGSMYKERLLALAISPVSGFSRIRSNRTVTQFRRRSRSLYATAHCAFCSRLQPLEDLDLHEVLLICFLWFLSLSFDLAF